MGTSIFLLLVIVLGMLAQSRVVVLASLILILFDSLNYRVGFTFLSKYGIEIGLICLLLSILSSMFLTPVNLEDIKSVLISRKGFAALVAGILATRFNGLGLNLLQDNPYLIVGIILGSLLGIVFLGGIPVGPLTAAGLTFIFMYLLEIIF